MKNLSVGLKLAASFGAVLILLSVVALWSTLGISGIVGNAEEVIDGNKLRGEIVQKEVDHLNWASKVNALLTDDTITELHVQTDDHKCGFGKWLYGEGRAEAEKLIPSLAGPLKSIEKPHAVLHASAVEINRVFKQADQRLPSILTSRAVDHLKWADAIRDTFLENKEKLTVQTDPTLCALGKWLTSSDAIAAYQQSDQMFRTEWDEMVKTHKELHASAVKIGSHYKRVHEGLENLLLKRLLDHKNWTQVVSQAVILGKADLGVQTDPTRCAYGKFLKSDELAEYKKGFPEIQKALDSSIEPHNKLHESAIAISNALAAKDKSKAEKIFQKTTLKALEQVGTALHNAISAESELHQGQIAAKTVFKDTTLPLLHKTLGHLQSMKEVAENNLEGMRTANSIFAAQTQPALKQTQELLKKVRETIDENVMTDDQMIASASQTNTAVIIISVFALLVGICFAYFMGRAISRPLSATVEMILEMAKGHLDRRLKMDSNDEIGQMAKAMDDFADDLQHETVVGLEKIAIGDLTFEACPKDEQDVIGNALLKTINDLNTLVVEIATAADQIAAGSGEVSDASQALSQGATQSAASLEQITSSMTELAANTKTNAENATQANQLAAEARTSADGGNKQMQSMVSAMQEINEAGQNISNIIRVIDEIAFQTNLLALNAAVEAARAGRHGKGFAVVAEEVRNLASRSAKAAKETAELIEGSVEKTETGTGIANQTAQSLNEIVTAITKVTDLVGEIATASNEQAEGISQVNQGLNQIDQVTQQNTASAEEGAAAAQELSSQAAHLKSLMGSFKVKGAESRGLQQQSLPGPSQHEWS